MPETRHVVEKVRPDDPRQRRVSDQARILYIHSLAILFNSGVAVDRSLEVLTRQTTDPGLQEASRGMCKTVRSGYPLSRAMGAYPWVFSLVHVCLVRMGEQTGALPQVLLGLSRWDERHWSLTCRLKSSLVVPVLVSLACMAMVAIMPPLVLDSLFAMIKESGVEIPWYTRVLMGISNLLRSPLLYALLSILSVTGWLAVRNYARTPQGRLRINRILAAIPVLGRIIHLISLVRVCRGLELCLQAGLPMLLSLELAGQVCARPDMERALDRASERLRNGSSLMQALESDAFPRLFLQALEVGGEAGDVPGMLRALGNLYEMSLEASLDVLAASLEPLVLLVVGIIVGVTMIAALSPLGGVLQAL